MWQIFFNLTLFLEKYINYLLKQEKVIFCAKNKVAKFWLQNNACQKPSRGGLEVERTTKFK